MRLLQQAAAAPHVPNLLLPWISGSLSACSSRSRPSFRTHGCPSCQQPPSVGHGFPRPPSERGPGFLRCYLPRSSLGSYSPGCWRGLVGSEQRRPVPRYPRALLPGTCAARSSRTGHPLAELAAHQVPFAGSHGPAVLSCLSVKNAIASSALSSAAVALPVSVRSNSQARQ